MTEKRISKKTEAKRSAIRSEGKSKVNGKGKVKERPHRSSLSASQEFQKYRYYEAAVQSASFEIEFLSEKYKEISGKAPRILREDFCGTGLVCCEWVKEHPQNMAIGIDLDEIPMQYGKENHLTRLTPSEQKRVQYVRENVMNAGRFKADIIVAFNFSYFIFKKRQELVKYFQSVRKSLNQKGIFFLDLFGGTNCYQRMVDRVDHTSFVYYWDCDHFNPVTHECLYKIHFKLKKSGKKYNDVFVYDWRHWTLPELHDILLDAGFREVRAYMEGDDEEGGGDGNFQVTKEIENCESWVSYLAALP